MSTVRKLAGKGAAVFSLLILMVLPALSIQKQATAKEYPASIPAYAGNEISEELSAGDWASIQKQIRQIEHPNLNEATGENIIHKYTQPRHFSQHGKLFAKDGGANDTFGSLVSIAEDTLVIGAPLDDIGGNADQGSAYVFSRNQGGADAWEQVAKITAEDGAYNDYFGSSVAIAGDTIVVGAIWAQVGSNSGQGAAYVFARNQGGADAWGQVAKLVANDGGWSENYGSSVAIDGNTIVVGAPYDYIGANYSQGSAYVFYRNQGGVDAWGQVAKLTAEDGAYGDTFGYSVSISGDTIVAAAIGADVGNNVNQGAAYLYKRNLGGPDAWGQVVKVTADDGAAYDNFGASVAIAGDTLVVGADGATIDVKLEQGAAYVFRRNLGGADAWGQVKKLIAEDGETQDRFGGSVAISGVHIVVGAVWADIGGSPDQGAAYVFRRNNGGAEAWGQVHKLTPEDGAADNLFGNSVAIAGDRIVAGAFHADIASNLDQGAAYLFLRNSESWVQTARAIASDGESGDEFGYSAALSGDTLVVGARYNDDNQGAAYVFRRNRSGADQWGQVAKLTAADGQWGEKFGSSVAIDGDLIVVGAPWTNISGSYYQGAAYIFARNQGGADDWGQVTKLVASDGVSGDQLGHSVDIDGDTIVSGAPGALRGNAQGSAYVFYRNQGGTDAWGQVTKVAASDGAQGDWFGFSIALSGDTFVAGAPWADVGGSPDQGAAYLFSRNLGGADEWGQVSKLTVEGGMEGGFLGWSVDMDGDTVVAGAESAEISGNPSQGAAYVFSRNLGGEDAWGQAARLTASDGAEGDWFGDAVAISGDTIVIGAINADIGGNQDQGAAYVFTRNQGGADLWGQAAKLASFNGTASDWFGFCVSIDEDTIVSGAANAEFDYAFSGAAYLFRSNTSPLAEDDRYSADEDELTFIASPGVLGNDSDVEGDSLGAFLESEPEAGSLTLSSGGSLIYTPTLNFNGVVTFTYHTSDGDLSSSPAEVTITVAPVNDPPLSAGENYQIQAGTRLVVGAPGLLANDRDVDGNLLIALPESSPAYGELVLNPDGSFTYTPEENYSGPDSFTYLVSDGELSSPAEVLITVERRQVFLPMVIHP